MPRQRRSMMTNELSVLRLLDANNYGNIYFFLVSKFYFVSALSYVKRQEIHLVIDYCFLIIGRLQLHKELSPVVKHITKGGFLIILADIIIYVVNSVLILSCAASFLYI